MAMGLVVVGIGAVLWLSARFQWLRLGNLPGDITILRPFASIYIPITTSLLLSLLLSAVFLAIRMIKR